MDEYQSRSRGNPPFYDKNKLLDSMTNRDFKVIRRNGAHEAN